MKNGLILSKVPQYLFKRYSILKSIHLRKYQLTLRNNQYFYIPKFTCLQRLGYKKFFDYDIIPSLTLNKKRNSAKLFNKGLKCCFVLCNEYAYII